MSWQLFCRTSLLFWNGPHIFKTFTKEHSLEDRYACFSEDKEHEEEYDRPDLTGEARYYLSIIIHMHIVQLSFQTAVKMIDIIYFHVDMSFMIHKLLPYLRYSFLVTLFQFSMWTETGASGENRRAQTKLMSFCKALCDSSYEWAMRITPCNDVPKDKPFIQNNNEATFVLHEYEAVKVVHII